MDVHYSVPGKTVDLTIETDEATADVSDNILVATTNADGILVDNPVEGVIYTLEEGNFKPSTDAYTHNLATLCFSVDPCAESEKKELTIEEGGTSTAIRTINTADTYAPAYNLQGIRVPANAKGIVIKNGKKTVNK